MVAHMRYFTADQHFGHVRINELALRPFKSVEEADEVMIERWNTIVRQDDDVFMLGDLAMGPFIPSVAKSSRLNGNKLLVPGNHDRVHPVYRQTPTARAAAAQVYADAGWQILGLQEGLELANGAHVELCHFPRAGDSHQDDRHVEYRPALSDAWLVHGHVHGQWKVRDRQVNVGVDVWEFAPVSEDELISVICD